MYDPDPDQELVMPAHICPRATQPFSEPDVPVAASWAAVAAYGLVSAWVLRRKLQAYEVVR